MPLWLTITTVILGLLFLSLQGLIFRHASMEMDSWSYPSAWWSLMDGHIDEARPPVYSAIVGIVWEFLTMGYGNILLPVIQWALYIAALQLLWRINTWLKVSKAFNAAAILSMLLIPGFWIFNNIIMAESVSLSGMILLVWLTGRYVLTRKNRYLLAITGGLIWAYTAEMKRTYGVASLAIASTHNRYCCLRADGAIIPEEISDPVTREKYRPLYDEDPGVQNPENRYMMEVYIFTWPEIERLVKEAEQHHPHAEIDGIIYRIKTSMSQSQFFFYLFGYYDDVDSMFYDWNGLSRNRDDGFIFPFHRYLWFPLWVTAAIWAAFTLIWLARWRKTRRFPAMAYFVSANILTCYVTAILGAQDLWGRIMTPVSPLIPVMADSVASITYGYVKKTLSGRRLGRRGFASLGKVA